MSEFLVEAYVSRDVAHRGAPGDDALALAAEALTREGRPVRFVRSIFVPEEETCFYLYQAHSREVVHEAAVRAGLSVERISEAKSVG